MVWGTLPQPPQPVILRPRPLQSNPGSFLLVPLLPSPKSATPLPAEIWTEIFSHVYYGEYNVDPFPNRHLRVERHRRDLLLICRALTNIVLPVFYSRVRIKSLWQLEKFTIRLHAADKQWDSLRRIPYSIPGRWVQELDLSSVECGGISLGVNELLTRLFPLLPFMAKFVLNTTMTLSSIALTALTFRDGNEHLKLKALKGIQAPITHPLDQPHYPTSAVDDDPLVKLIRRSDHLEEIEIFGPGFDLLELDFVSQVVGDLPPVEVAGEESVPQISNPLKLKNLKSLSMPSTHASPLMFSLLSSELPSLQRLVVTPCDDVPYPTSLVSKFIQIHGSTLRSLHLYTTKGARKVSRPSPSDILLTCPNLIHLSLEFPLPQLTVPQGGTHPLQILSIPRPNQHCYQIINTIVSSLRNLQVICMRDVRWLPRGIATQAMETGTQGEMRAWKRKFVSHGVTVLDADMNSYEDLSRG